jgi:hypothetical protein
LGKGLSPIDGVLAGDPVQKGDETKLEVCGIYYDDIARTEHEWSFTHRLYVPMYVATGADTMASPSSPGPRRAS